ncbi:MAG: CBASS cGAMP synthase [Patescibacteria group bacterium]
MSKNSSQFYSTNPDIQTLHKKIIPSDGQNTEQTERWNDLRDYLVEDLAEKTGYLVTSWLQGSYKFETQIRPGSMLEEFDIDLGIYFNWSGGPDDGKYTPIQLKKMVLQSLVEYQLEAKDEVLNVADPKTRCARIHFLGNFHIDVPVYHIDPDRDIRHLATEDNVWENSDPKALYAWFKKECNESQNGQQLRRLVRYLKMWATQKFREEERPSTILLTVLVVKAFKELSLVSSDDDFVFENCIGKVIESLNLVSIVENPVDTKENLNRMPKESFANFLHQLTILYEIAKRGTSASTQADASMIWQEAFHHFFPLPEELKNSSSAETALMVVQFTPEIHVSAQPKDNFSIRPYIGQNKIGPIPKNCNISFVLTNYLYLPYGCTLEWMVRNEGGEAEEMNDLGHFSGKAVSMSRNSAYNGTHFMDIVVKTQHGTPIGFRRVPVTIDGPAIPPRNPKNKPGWRKIKNKKR